MPFYLIEVYDDGRIDRRPAGNMEVFAGTFTFTDGEEPVFSSHSNRNVQFSFVGADSSNGMTLRHLRWRAADLDEIPYSRDFVPIWSGGIFENEVELFVTSKEGGSVTFVLTAADEGSWPLAANTEARVSLQFEGICFESDVVPKA